MWGPPAIPRNLLVPGWQPPGTVLRLFNGGSVLHLGFRMVSQFVVQLRALKNLLPVFLVLRDGLVKHRGFMIWFGFRNVQEGVQV